MAPSRRPGHGAPAPARGTWSTGDSPGEPSSPLPPAQMAVHLGRRGPGAVVRRRLMAGWVVAMALASLAGWAFWQLPVVLAVPLLALDVIGAVVTTALIGLFVAVLSRASVAAGEGWVGFRVLRRWRVVRRVVPGEVWGQAGGGTGGGGPGGGSDAGTAGALGPGPGPGPGGDAAAGAQGDVGAAPDEDGPGGGAGGTGSGTTG